MTYTTDNRWSPGSSGTVAPDDATAAYAARWIDMGDGVRADIVPDRQGFAYNDETNDRQALVNCLVSCDAANLVPEPRDVATEIKVVGDDDRFHLVMRRAGGYVYVDAWLSAEVAS